MLPRIVLSCRFSDEKNIMKFPKKWRFSLTYVLIAEDASMARKLFDLLLMDVCATMNAEKWRAHLSVLMSRPH